MFLYVFSLPVFSQIKDEIDPSKHVIPYDEMSVAFALDGTLTAKDGGFDKPTSSWKFSYELRVLNDGSIGYELQKGLRQIRKSGRTANVAAESKQGT